MAQIGADAAPTSIECSIRVSVEIDPMALPATENPPWAACTIVTITGTATSSAATRHAASSPLGTAIRLVAERRLVAGRTGHFTACIWSILPLVVWRAAVQPGARAGAQPE